MPEQTKTESKKILIGTINVRPKWTDQVEEYFFWLEAGTANEKELAKTEIRRLAALADEYLDGKLIPSDQRWRKT